MFKKDENGYWQINICDADVKSIETIVNYLNDEQKEEMGGKIDWSIYDNIFNDIKNDIKVLENIFQRCKERENFFKRIK